MDFRIGGSGGKDGTMRIGKRNELMGERINYSSSSSSSWWKMMKSHLFSSFFFCFFSFGWPIRPLSVLMLRPVYVMYGCCIVHMCILRTCWEKGQLFSLNFFFFLSLLIINPPSLIFSYPFVHLSVTLLQK